jgi:hypothetical protein
MRKTRSPKREYPKLDEHFHGLGYSHGHAMDHRLPDPSWTNLQKVSFILGYDSGFADAYHALEKASEVETARLVELITIEQGLKPGEFWDGPGPFSGDSRRR